MTDRGLAGQVMDALWPILGGNHTSAELWNEIGEAVDAALTASQEQQQTIQRLTSALNVAKAAILKAAEDTLWCDDSPAETVIDRIDAALDPDETVDMFQSPEVMGGSK